MLPKKRVQKGNKATVEKPGQYYFSLVITGNVY